MRHFLFICLSSIICLFKDNYYCYDATVLVTILLCKYAEAVIVSVIAEYYCSDRVPFFAFGGRGYEGRSMVVMNMFFEMFLRASLEVRNEVKI